MYKLKGTSDIITFQNEQCTCFGSPTYNQDQFLAKHKTFQGAPSSDTNLKSYNHEQSFAKNSFKKSLKRPLLPLTPLSKSPHPPITDYLLQSKSPNPLEKSPEIRQFLSPQSKGSTGSCKTYMVPSEQFGAFYAVRVPQREVISCKNIQPPPLPSLAAFHSPAKTIKINYASPPYASPYASYASPKRTSPVSATTSPPPHTTSPPPHTHTPRDKEEADRSESTKIVSKVPGEAVKGEGVKEETSKSCVRVATMKSGIGFGKAKAGEAGKSIIGSLKGKHEGKRQGETGRSRIDIKSLKEHKHALKKMDDVEEIYSQPDSEELSDSDKESVVLGRLNEYGSMIDPALSHTSAQSESKITRFNSLSVDIDHEIPRTNNPANFLTH